MKFQFNDGGRVKAGYKGFAGDCVTRSIAIATGKSYKIVYNDLNTLAKSERRGKSKRGISSARNGVYRTTIKKYLHSLGWEWTPTMHIGSGCNVHLKTSELPEGTLILSLSKHITCVVDGIINDTHDCSRNGTRCVYGYWQLRG